MFLLTCVLLKALISLRVTGLPFLLSRPRASHVRRAMVNVMFGSARRSCVDALEDDAFEADRRELSALENAYAAGERRERTREALPGSLAVRSPKSSDPADCMLWCAIAAGALMQGQPPEHVREAGRGQGERSIGWSHG